MGRKDGKEAGTRTEVWMKTGKKKDDDMGRKKLEKWRNDEEEMRRAE